MRFVEMKAKSRIKERLALLKAAGCDCGMPDGAAGEKTAAALAEFQRDQALTENGKPDHETLMTLYFADLS